MFLMDRLTTARRFGSPHNISIAEFEPGVVNVSAAKDAEEHMSSTAAVDL